MKSSYIILFLASIILHSCVESSSDSSIKVKEIQVSPIQNNASHTVIIEKSEAPGVFGYDSIDQNLSIYFQSFSTEFQQNSNDSLFSDPVLVWNGKSIQIKDFNVYCVGDYQLSPNNKYLTMGRLDIGWVEGPEERFLHDRADYVIVEISSGRILHYFEYGGHWNEKNQWVEGDEILWYVN